MLRKAFYSSKMAELWLWILNIQVIQGMMKIWKKYVISLCRQIINNVFNILDMSYDTCHCSLSEDIKHEAGCFKMCAPSAE